MNSLKNVLEVLEQIASEPRRLEKEKIINQNAGTENFKKVVFFALDFNKIFHISGMDKASGEQVSKPSVDKIFKLLDKFSSKTGITDKERQALCDMSHAVDEETAEVVDRILQKDLKCGASLKTFKKTFPTLPVFEIMTCRSDIRLFLKLVEKTKSDVLVSMKKDGVRTCGRCGKYISRSGKEYHNFSIFDEELSILSKFLEEKYGLHKDTFFDGEVTVKNGNFQEVMRNVRTFDDGEPEYIYNIFDIGLLDGTELKLRMKMLGEAFKIHRFQHITLLQHIKIANSHVNEEILKNYMKNAVKNGEEGIVVKLSDSPYELKEKSKYWLKMKPVETYDLLVVGKFGGRGRLKNTLGGLIVKYNDKEVKVGSGYTDEERELFMKKQPGIIEVKCKGETEDGSLREPIFVRVRDDKSTVTDE